MFDDLFKKYYLEDYLSLKDIAQKLNLTYNKVIRYIKNNNLKRDSNKIRGYSVKKTKKNNFNNLLLTITYDRIYNDYIIQNKSHKELQLEYNITSYTLDKIIDTYNIHKSKSQASSLVQETKSKKYGGKEAYNKHVEEKKTKTIIDKYGSLENYYDKRNNKAIDTFKVNWGYSHPMKNKNHRESIINNGFKSSLEKRFEQFLMNNNFNYKSHYVITKDNFIHEFDFALFKDNKLSILIDCDGLFYHNYNIDENGQTNNAPGDTYRMLLIPENVKFIVCVENDEEKAYREVLDVYNISFDEYVNDVFTWCRTLEFPYPEYKDNVINNSYKNLCQYKPENFKINSRPGMKVIKHFHRSIYKANKKNKLSPFNAWNDDKLLIKCIKNRLIYKGNNLDASKVLAGFSASAIAPVVSVFNPYLAKYIIKKYLDEFNTIFDPCSGYSGRLIGATSLNKTYIGQDINEEVVKESNNIIKHFNFKNAKITCCDSLKESGTYDCLFTCSPYGDKENWNQNIKILSCDQWIDECLAHYTCKKYIFVVDNTLKYKDKIVEKLTSKSHFGVAEEYIILIEK